MDMRHQTIPMEGTSYDHVEIVEEIMDNLRPWTRPESDVEAGVQQAIKSIKEQVSREASLYNRSAIKSSAEEVGEAIADLEKSLQRIHPIVKSALFPWEPREEMPPEPWGSPNPRPPNPEPPDPWGAWVDELKQRRMECEQLARNPRGYHPNFGYAQRGCARHAFALMREFSKQAPTGTADGPFRTITSLLYQAVSEKRQDMKKACDLVLQADRKEQERRRLGEIAWAKAGFIKVDGGWLPPPDGWPDDDVPPPPDGWLDDDVPPF
jgi:hypothetical protein